MEKNNDYLNGYRQGRRYSDSRYHRGKDARRGYAGAYRGNGSYRAAGTRGSVSRAAGKGRPAARAVISKRGRTARRRMMIRAAGMLLVFSMLLTVGFGAAKAMTRLIYPRRYEHIVRENCQRFDVEESLVYAVIRTESGFDPKAQSSVGALGLMQIMPDTFRWLKTKLPAEGIYQSGEYSDEEMLLDPEVNIRYGVYFISILREEFGSDTLAEAAYHAGMGKVRQWVSSGTLAAESRYDEIPSGVTSHYVYKVEKARKVYSDLYY